MENSMPKKEAEADDPMEIVGVEFAGQTEAQLHDMVLCFAEEFIREGWREEQLMEMFQNPFYQGPHLAWKQKGDDYIRSVIQEAMKMWRPAYSEARPDGRPERKAL